MFPNGRGLPVLYSSEKQMVLEVELDSTIYDSQLIWYVFYMCLLLDGLALVSSFNFSAWIDHVLLYNYHSTRPL